jgi:hypothetical protein
MEKEPKKRVYEVSDSFRTNELSLIPGGFTIEVHYDNKIVSYKNIKNPQSYIKSLTKNPKNEIIKILVDGNLVNYDKK